MKIAVFMICIIFIAGPALMAADMERESRAKLLLDKADKAIVEARILDALVYLDEIAKDYANTKAADPLSLKYAEVYRGLGDDALADKYLDKAIEHGGLTKAWACALAADRQISLGHLGIATDLLSRIHAISPTLSDLGPYNSSMYTLGKLCVDHSPGVNIPILKDYLKVGDGDWILDACTYYRAITGDLTDTVKLMERKPSAWAQVEAYMCLLQDDTKQGRATAINCKGQIGELAALDVNAMIEQGLATCTTTKFDFGTVRNLFDDNPASLWRSAGLNPAEITLEFKEPQPIRQFKVRFSNATELEAYKWSIEPLTKPRSSPSDTEQVEYLPETQKVKSLRLLVQRLTGDSYVHINDWTIYIKPSQVTPSANAVKLASLLPDMVGDQNARATVILGRYYARIGKPEEAVALLKQGSTDAAPLLYDLGRLQFKTGDFEGAKATFNMLIAKKPLSTQATAAKYYLEVCSIPHINQPIIDLIKTAIAGYSQRWAGMQFTVPEGLKDDPRLVVMSAVSLAADGKVEEAVALLDALPADTTLVQAKVELSMFALRSTVGTDFPRDAAIVLNGLVPGHPDLAIQIAQECATIPANGVWKAQMGHMCAQLYKLSGNWYAAYLSYSSIIDTRPNRAEQYRYEAASALYNTGSTREAIKLMKALASCGNKAWSPQAAEILRKWEVPK